MDKNGTVYFVNSQGKKTVLSSPDNHNYWEVRGRRGFTATDVDLFTQKYASGKTKYFGKTLKPRTCSLQMVCKGKNTAELDKIFFDMLDVLMDNGSDQEGKLYLRRSDGTPVSLNCVYSGGMNIEEQYRKFRTFPIEFYAADPLFYYDKVYEIDLGGEFTPNYTDIAFTNDTGQKIWPEFHFNAKPVRTLVHSYDRDPFFRKDYAVWLTILKYPIYKASIPEYYNISIYTDPKKRGAFGDRVINDVREVNASISEILDDASVLQYFGYDEGTHHLDYEAFVWNYGNPGGTIVLPKFKYYLGA